MSELKKRTRTPGEDPGRKRIKDPAEGLARMKLALKKLLRVPKSNLTKEGKERGAGT